MRCALGREILGQLPPLATGSKHVQNTVDERAPGYATLWREERLYQRILVIGQIALLAQTLALVASAVLGRPHGGPGESTRTGAQNHNRFCRLKKIPDGLLDPLQAKALHRFALVCLRSRPRPPPDPRKPWRCQQPRSPVSKGSSLFRSTCRNPQRLSPQRRPNHRDQHTTGQLAPVTGHSCFTPSCRPPSIIPIYSSYVPSADSCSAANAVHGLQHYDSQTLSPWTVPTHTALELETPFFSWRIWPRSDTRAPYGQRPALRPAMSQYTKPPMRPGPPKSRTIEVASKVSGEPPRKSFAVPALATKMSAYSP